MKNNKNEGLNVPIIITSDIHIHDYPSCNYGDPDFRLNQFTKLAHRLVEIGKDKNSKTIFLAGDIAHVPVMAPHIAHVVAQFFSILETQFKDISYILGQHDLNSKNTEQEPTDSFIPVLADQTSAKYMNRKIVEIGGRKIAFSNWQSELDWSFIKEPVDPQGRLSQGVDILISHVTLGEADFCQPFDNSKYDIGFFGDIHCPFSLGNSHTINVPIPHYGSDCQEGSVICLNTADLSWERINTETENTKFLKIYHSEDEYDKEHPYLSIRNRPYIPSNSHIVHNGINVQEVIKDAVKGANLVDFHKSITSSIDRTDVSNVDFNFTLNAIKIKNFKSIESLDYSFQSGLTLIGGESGSGKSALMGAIEYCLLGGYGSPVYLKSGEKDMAVNLTLTHRGNLYKIQRSYDESKTLVTDFDFSVNGSKIAGSSVKAREQLLIYYLPFLKHFDIISRSLECTYNDRIDLLSDVLGLGIIKRYFRYTKKRLKSPPEGKGKLFADHNALFSPYGPIMKAMLSGVAKSISSPEFAIETVRIMSTGEERFDFSPKLKVGDNFLPYDTLSAGQKTVADIYFFCRVFGISGGVGCLLIDEEISTDCIKMLKEAPVQSVLVASSVARDNLLFDNVISAELVGNNSIYRVTTR